MKLRIYTFLLLLFATSILASGKTFKVTGCIADTTGNAVEFATIVLSQQGQQKYGTATDENGCFNINAIKGKYGIQVSFVGFDTYKSQIDITSETDLGKIILKSNSVMMKELTVTANLIRREADRFVMNVENQPIAIGKDGEEILRQAPGVFIQNDKISINGKSGVKIWINDREITLSDKDLLAYLRSLRAEDMNKIEVIPMSGVEYSADSQSGIIKITTKTLRNSGLIGSVGITGNFGKMGNSVSPQFSLNHNKGKITTNVQLWGNYGINRKGKMTDDAVYEDGVALNSVSKYKTRNETNGGGTAGVVYDMNKQNSLGFEMSFWGNIDNDNKSEKTSNFAFPGYIKTSHGKNIEKYNHLNLNPKINYTLKLDTTGSTFKAIATYAYFNSNGANNGSRVLTVNDIAEDSIFVTDTGSENHRLNISADLEKIFNDRWTLRAGAKYTYNKQFSDSYRAHEKNSVWHEEPGQCYNVAYDENIAAIYISGAFSLSRWKFNAGLRGEYARTSGDAMFGSKSYFDLFPNAYAMYLFTDKGDYTASLGYSRRISRPSFWALNPNRMTLSDYMTQCGNPDLKPSYGNSFDLNLSLAYKYSLSFSYGFMNDAMTQAYENDPLNPQGHLLTWENIGNSRYFSINAYAPINIGNWFGMTINAGYVYGYEKGATGKPVENNNLYYSANLSFTLPYDFIIEIGTFGQTKVRTSNIEVPFMMMLWGKVKKMFCDKKWTVSAGVDKIDGRDFVFKSNTPSFSRTMRNIMEPQFKVSLTYNFNSGKKFNTRHIENNEDSRGGKSVM